MNSADWLNISRCADLRVQASTFSFDDEENNILGDLETREMAKWQAYRATLINNIYIDVVMGLCDKLGMGASVLSELDYKEVQGVKIIFEFQTSAE